MAIYEGGMRALDLTGAAFDLTGKRFTVLGKQAKAFGAGIQAATEFEKVRGNYTDFLNQLEVNSQKGITLSVNQAKTISDRTTATYKKEEIAVSSAGTESLSCFNGVLVFMVVTR